MKFFCPKLLLATVLTLLFPACQTLYTPSGAPQEEIRTALELEANQSWLEAAQAYQLLATKSGQPERSSFLIKSALMLYYAGSYADIATLFDSRQQDDIVQQDKHYQATLLAGAYFGEGRIYQSLLTLPPIEDIVDYRYKVLALKIRSQGLLAIGKPKQSAELRMQISGFLRTEEEIEQNHTFIWNALNQITETSIINALSSQQTSEVRGWLELNLIARRSNMMPDKIEPWINQWYQQYTDHAAAKLFARNLLEESRRIYIKPERIALMLPLSGRLKKVSEAIQNVFVYAYYQDQTLKAELEIINASTDAAEFNLQYHQAIENGADLVVGPIDKDLIELLQTQEGLEVPTLALNYGDEAKMADFNLYQFGLSPEDEAEQIADYALAEGRRYAVTLVPDTEWGSRLQRAFKTRFEALGGHVVGSESYPSKKSDYSAAIKKLLHLMDSDQRQSMIQQVIGQPVKFEPRRRQDVDMVFIAANSRQARLIKPQLKFHHAQDLTVYATSHISSSAANADDDRDLDGIRFVDIPWMLDNRANRDHKNIAALWPDSSRQFGRLFALGIDAYRLIPSLRRLIALPQESVLYHTGQLSIDSKGRVKRALLMATYNNGAIELLQSPGALLEQTTPAITN